MNVSSVLNSDIFHAVQKSLMEDVGQGDLTANLLPSNKESQATIISRESAVICGIAWVNEVYRQLDPNIIIKWHVREGEKIIPDQRLCEITGNARAIVTGERVALNFLQTLSATATVTSQYVAALENTRAKLLDTRKTLPGMRHAQKYAVRCGGGQNHRLGLYDAFLIKENHIAACGSIAQAIASAQAMQTGKPIEIEVENLAELSEALLAGADIIMLDNFSLGQIKEAVKINSGKAKLEVSGGVDLTSIRELAETGVDYISVGALTKHIRAIDLSMRIQPSAAFLSRDL